MSAFSHITCAARSDIGRKRKNNEDSFGTFPAVGVFCVADGMGGGDDGEVASAATVRAVETFARENSFPPKAAYSARDVVSALQASVNDASKWILTRAQAKHLKGCGSTFVGIVFDAARPEQAVALHAGDSRLYRIRGRAIQQMTKDHSAAALIGAKDENDINPMFRGMILRAVGIQDTVELEETPVPVQEGDRLLLCSDGLSRMVPDEQILSVLRENEALDAAADALIAAANDAGGVDNVTVVLLQVGTLPTALPAVVMSQDRSPVQTDMTLTAERSTDSTTQNTAGDGNSAPSATMTIPEESDEEMVKLPVRRPMKLLPVAFIILALLVLGCVLGALQWKRNETQRMAEAQRQAKLLASAEADRLAEERRKEAERKAEEEKNRKEDEARRQAEIDSQRRLEALEAFEKVCETDVAAAFVRKVLGILGKEMPDSISTRFRPLMHASSRSQEYKLAAAVELTRDVQVIARKLMDYARKYLKDIEAGLNDSATTEENRNELKEAPAKIAEFLKNADSFVGQSPDNPDAQFTCILMIRSIPSWF